MNVVRVISVVLFGLLALFDSSFMFGQYCYFLKVIVYMKLSRRKDVFIFTIFVKQMEQRGICLLIPLELKFLLDLVVEVRIEL